MKTLAEMRQLFKEGRTQELTLDKIEQLKGKTIQTIFFGYRGQDMTDCFVVGDVFRDVNRDRLLLYKDDRSYSYIFCCDGSHFVCSDSDRQVYFILS